LIDAGIDVKINLVLNKYNYLELDEIIKRICGLGVKEIRLLRLVCGGRAKENWDDIGVTYRQQNEQIARILDKLDEYHFKITIAGFPEKYPCRPFDAARKCQAGLNILYITYQGNLFPCACVKNNQKHLIGHISNDKEIKTFLEKTRKIKCHNHCLNPVL
jgi:MoaA/NifB/PqqE/SkfB family radical SAM enzyme